MDPDVSIPGRYFVRTPPRVTWPGPCHYPAGQSCGRAACKVFGPGWAGFRTGFLEPGSWSQVRGWVAGWVGAKSKTGPGTRSWGPSTRRSKDRVGGRLVTESGEPCPGQCLMLRRGRCLKPLSLYPSLPPTGQLIPRRHTQPRRRQSPVGRCSLPG